MKLEDIMRSGINQSQKDTIGFFYSRQIQSQKVEWWFPEGDGRAKWEVVWWVQSSSFAR